MGDENMRSTTCEQTDETSDNSTENIPESAQNMTGDGNKLSNRITDSSGHELNDKEKIRDTVNDVLNSPSTRTETESVLRVDNNNKVVDDDSSADMSLTLKIEFEANDNETKKQQVHEKDKQKNDDSVDNTEDISKAADDNLGNIDHETQSNDESRNYLQAPQNIDDAPLTYVDQDDGILKYLVGKACSGDKKKLLDEDHESYSKRHVKPIDTKTTFYSVQPSNEAVGERLAHQGARIRSPTRSHTSVNKAISMKNKGKSKYMELEENETERKGNLYTKRSDAKSPGRRPMSPRNKGSQNASRVPRNEHSYSVDEDCYDFTHSQRGYMVLVVNDQFARQSPRDGAIWDLRKMKEIGRKFGFRELHYQMKDRNLTKPELLDVLTDAQRTDHSDCDCFLLMISTHGLENINARKGGKTDHALVCADDQLIFTSTIIEMFNDSNCPSLKGKPKIFLIQACRGELVDDGGKIYVAHSKNEDRTCGVTNTGNVHSRSESFDVSDTRHGNDSWAMKQSTSRSQAVNREPHSTREPPQFYVPNVSHASSSHGFVNVHTALPKNWASSQTVQRIYAPTPYAIVDTPSLKCDNDMLVMYAIPPGMFAWRNTSEGSWMIDYLHKVLMNHNLKDPKNFLNLLTKVNALMSRRATYTPSQPQLDGKTAISVIEHKLSKDIVFQQKVPLSDWRR